MGNTSSSSSAGIGFTGVLTILFIALKLTGVIGWSWWWVLSPLWISFALTIVVLLISACTRGDCEDCDGCRACTAGIGCGACPDAAGQEGGA